MLAVKLSAALGSARVTARFSKPVKLSPADRLRVIARVSFPVKLSEADSGYVIARESEPVNVSPADSAAPVCLTMLAVKLSVALGSAADVSFVCDPVNDSDAENDSVCA